MLKFAFCRCFHLIWHFEGRFGCLLEGGFFKKICSQPIHSWKSCQKPLLPEASRAVFDQNEPKLPKTLFISQALRESLMATRSKQCQSFKSDTTVSTTTTFLTETKEGGEERKRLYLLPSFLALVRNVFSGNPFKIVSIVGLDGNKSHL